MVSKIYLLRYDINNHIAHEYICNVDVHVNMNDMIVHVMHHRFKEM